MEERELHSVEELESQVADLRKLIKEHQKHDYQILSKVLFRGQENSTWGIETTLERYTNKTYSINRYNETLWAISHVISSFTGQNWEIPRNEQFDDKLYGPPPNYDFMSYVRHHGFPSPLLDWTQSLYVALFFAYYGLKPGNNVAIYCYIESLNSGKSGWLGSSEIRQLGPYVKSHKRHFSQQGQYTVAVRKNNNDWVYCPHSEAFNNSTGLEQDLLYKFILPGELKNNILMKLYEMNINSFTLYSSEESLMDMLAFKEITMRNL